MKKIKVYKSKQVSSSDLFQAEQEDLKKFSFIKQTLKEIRAQLS